MKKLFKYFLFSIPLILGGVLASCGNDTKAPVYKGMRIESCVINNVKRVNEVVESNVNDTPILTNDIEDLVTIKVNTTSETSYYVNPGEKFTLVVELENPNAFEIQSFTLNGTKYANYMFKEGSDLEHLYLEVDAPNDPGLYEYTIDKIKYIDGEDIKDVDLSKGEQTIKAGIEYTSEPTAVVSNEIINTNDISLDVELTDYLDLIKDKEVKIYLSDGEKIVKEQKLTLGTNHIKFDNLKENTTYQYGVMTSYDLLDGKNEKERILSKDTFNTLAMYKIENVVPSFEEVKFNATRTRNLGELVKVSIYDQDQLVQTLERFDNLEFKNLLSNHDYKIKVSYKYLVGNSEVTGSIYSEFKTLEYTEPTVEFKDVTSTYDSINFELNNIVVNMTSTIEKIELYKGEELVSTLDDVTKKEFTSLLSNTEYILKVAYSYDLNDGKGNVNKNSTYKIKTLPYIKIESSRLISDNSIVEGETIFLEYMICNPNNLDVKFAIINGERYQVDLSSTKTRIFVNIVNENQFTGGLINLKLQTLILDDGEDEYAVDVSEKGINIFVNGKISIIEAKYVDENNTDLQYLIVDNSLVNTYKAKVIINFDNTSDYVINEVVCNTGIYVPTKIDINNWYIEVPVDYGKVITTIYGFNYSNEYLNKTIDNLDISASLYIVKGKRNIENSNDLLNMNDNYYYILKNDIDLSGINWSGYYFTGVFDGNNHSIINMTYIKDNNDQYLNLGLFKSASGYIFNLKFKNIFIKVTTATHNEEYISYGAVASYSSNGITLKNITIDENSVISIMSKGNDKIDIGGLIGCIGTTANIINCHNKGNINVLIDENKSNSRLLVIRVGGLLSFATNVNIIDCSNYGKICGDNYAGGLVGHIEQGDIYNSFNFGYIEGEDFIGGLVGRIEHGSIISSSNAGVVKGHHCVGGLVGRGSPENDLSSSIVIEINNCFNLGNVIGNENSYDIGGICGNAYKVGIYNTFNSGNISGNHDVGGIIGANGNYSLIKNSINYGKATAKWNNASICGFEYNHYYDFINCYTTIKNNDTETAEPIENVNSKEFYINTLKWDESIWILDNLDTENGKYPTLK